MNKQVAACVEGEELWKICDTVTEEEKDEFPNPIPWQKIESEGLDCDYGLLFSKDEADRLFMQLEDEVEYFTAFIENLNFTPSGIFEVNWNINTEPGLIVQCEAAKILVYGKMYSIPRKQATYGEEGLMYSFSGVHLAARAWTPTLEYIRDAVTNATGQTFNFVLINRYKDGLDHIGEHRDDERELDPTCPIASVSLGAPRDFIFRHRDSRRGQNKPHIEPVKLELAHGSLLLMNSPTNTYWYHSLPVRKKVKTPRINLTFRRVVKARQRKKQ